MSGFMKSASGVIWRRTHSAPRGRGLHPGRARDDCGPVGPCSERAGATGTAAAPRRSPQGRGHLLSAAVDELSNASLPLADGIDLTLRISEGVMCNSQSSDGSLDTLLQRADEALYRAKRAGRDQVCGFSAELLTEASAAAR